MNKINNQHILLSAFLPSTLKLTEALLIPAGLDAVSVYIPSSSCSISCIVSINRSFENISLVSLDFVISSSELRPDLIIVKLHLMFDTSTSGDARSILNLNEAD